MADGSITIEAKVLTDKFDKQIQKLDEKISKKEKQKIKISTEIADIEKQQAEYKKLTAEAEKYKKTVDYIQEVQFRRGQQGLPALELTESSKDIINKYANVQRNIEASSQSMKKLSQRSDELAEKSNEITQSIKKYKNQIESVKLQKQQAQVDQIKNGFNKMNTSVSSSIKHIGRLALGIFSVASAYRLMSSASSTLGQYDEQYATNLEYIRYLIAQAIAPALKYVVNLASTLLSYLNYILNAWFGITLFSKNSSKNFMKARESTSKIKKDLQTTPFDEMNVLSDTSSSGTSGAVVPSIDPSMLQGEVPDWLKWIVDNKDLILSVISGVTAGLLAWKLGLDGIKALGIGLMIAGIVYTIESLLDYLKNPSWENFGKIIQGIGIFVIGLGVAFLGLPAIITGVIIAIVGTIIKYWEQIKTFLQSGIDWLKSKSDWIHNMFGDTIGDIYDYLVETLQHVLDAFDSLFTMLKNIIDDVIKIVKDIIHGDWKQAWEDAKQLVVDIFQGLWNTIKNVFFAIASLGVSIATAVGGTISSIFKAIVNAILSAIENILNKPIKTVNAMIGVVNAVPGVNIPTLPTFKLPRLAKGTILNAPGRGVPVAGGTALAGEAGREAYLPLSDTQLLEELGSTIGKYITINANIPVSVGNRQIARVIKKINTESDFAFNR